METQFPIVQIIDPDGNLIERDSSLITEQHARRFYEQLVTVRTFDRKAISLQRQGRIGTYAPYEGQEAAQVGSAFALESEDWMFPTYRDHGATMTFGQPLLTILQFWSGRLEGGTSPEGKKIFPPAVPIATQLLHAVGAAWAEKKKQTANAAIVYFGDGATSEGDFHEALNFASVFKAPVVFFNQNNRYAISVPIEKQMNSKTIAQKALAYDMAGIRVDGNDVFAVYRETRNALEQARKHGKPTLIEAVTWRYGAHTTADDPGKYRDQGESESYRNTIDPLLRVERLMKQQKWWNEAWAAEVQKTADQKLEQAVTELEALESAQVADMFDYVFAEPTWTIQQQKDAFLKFKKEEASR